MLLSQKFRDTFRDIYEKALLALGLSASAVSLHFAQVGCQALHLPAWIVLMVEWTFDVIVISDCVTITSLAIALPIRVVVDTVRELRGYLG